MDYQSYYDDNYTIQTDATVTEIPNQSLEDIIGIPNSFITSLTLTYRDDSSNRKRNRDKSQETSPVIDDTSNSQKKQTHQTTKNPSPPTSKESKRQQETNYRSIQFHTYTDADSFIQSSTNNLKDWITYIPYFKIYRHAIIRDVDITLTIEKICNTLKKNLKIEIIHIEKMHRFNKEKKDLEPTNQIKLTFKVILYVQKVRTCMNCFRYGYSTNQCRSKSKYQNCAQNTHGNNESCTNSTKCLNCSQTHPALSPSCPSLKFSTES